jgi:hypothetical protein
MFCRISLLDFRFTFGSPRFPKRNSLFYRLASESFENSPPAPFYGAAGQVLDQITRTSDPSYSAVSKLSAIHDAAFCTQIA